MSDIPERNATGPGLPASPVSRAAAAIRREWNGPRHAWWIVALSVTALVLRKPWALHTPQLHAEDGSIFLTQDEQFGARAFLEPYMGYLHLLPRLIAWTASHTADPAWWPAIYNGACLVITVALFARLMSPRLALPGKPWLLLAFALVPHTGEVFFNITNLQWITAFFLLLQVLIARPVGRLERGIDLLQIAAVGLTGPFAAVFLPLFAWRWWRERQSDALAGLLVAAACCGIQGWFLLKVGPQLEQAPATWRPGMLLAVLGSRLVVWPAFGPSAAQALPLPVLATLGTAGIATLAALALRPHPRRHLRLQVLVAIALITAAAVIRVRPDAWETANLVNGDRYFYIPRVLLAWLVIWEFDAGSRIAAYAARGLALAGVLLQAPHYKLPNPPDYHWAENCDPIRRGVPANIKTLPEGWWIEYPGRTNQR